LVQYYTLNANVYQAKVPIYASFKALRVAKMRQSHVGNLLKFVWHTPLTFLF